jgi:hypothetical protein
MRVVEFAILALISGILMPSSVATSTNAVWDGANCPPGISQITAVARDNAGRTFTSDMTTVELPAPHVVTSWPDLPSGSFQATATSRRSDGRTFTSDPQFVVGPSATPGLGEPGERRDETTIPSQVAITSPIGGARVGGWLTMRVTAPAGAASVSVELRRLEGDQPASTVQCSRAGGDRTSWQCVADLGRYRTGRYGIIATAADVAGLTTRSVPPTIDVRARAPEPGA